MEGTAILEREIIRRSAPQKEESVAEKSAAEAEHARRISENFNALRYRSAEAWYNPAVREEEAPVRQAKERYEAPAQQESVQRETSAMSNTQQRIKDYSPVAAPEGKKVLFEGLAFKNGALVGTLPAPAKAINEVSAPATVPVEDDDAVPTRRTMDTLSRPAAVAAEEAKVSFLSCLSAKGKAALISVACTIVLAIILICVATGVIGSLDRRIESLRVSTAQAEATYEELEQSIEKATSDERIEEFARSHGMVHD